MPEAIPYTPNPTTCLRGMRMGKRNLLPLPLEMLLPPLRLLPLPQLPREAAMARDRLPLVGRSMPE